MDYQFLIELGLGCTSICYVFNRVLNYMKTRTTQQTKVALKGKDPANPLSKFTSFQEMASQTVELLDMQVKKIGDECTKQGKNPMEDTGYNTVLKQYQQALAWQTRLESPFFRLFDSIAFPFVKDLSGTAVKRLMEVIS